MARRGDPELLVQLDAGRRARRRLRDADRSAGRRPAAGQRAVEAGRAAAPRRRRRRGRAGHGREPGARARPRPRWPTRPARWSGSLRELLLRIPNLPSELAPDGLSEADNPVVKGPVNLPRAFPDHQRVPHWESATALGILDNERADEDQRGDVHDATRPRRHAVPGAVPAGARPQRGRVRGDPAALAGHDGHAHRHRPAARSSPTTPTPSSATTCGASRRPRCRSPRIGRGRDPRRGRPAGAA